MSHSQRPGSVNHHFHWTETKTKTPKAATARAKSGVADPGGGNPHPNAVQSLEKSRIRPLRKKLLRQNVINIFNPHSVCNLRQ